ncbi:uncharacterized protein [Temnothorax longispinosus]|uniref:uncharacterized protein n=1 Tax=Temnothorax longispinosus TaxID=300112 RepID=UPI003A995B6D
MLKTMKTHYYIRREDLRVTLGVTVYLCAREGIEAICQKQEVFYLAGFTNSGETKQKEGVDASTGTRVSATTLVRAHTALRPLITAHGQITAFDFAGTGNGGNSPSSSTCSSNNGGSNTSNQQKGGHRRTKTNPSANASSSQ